MASETAPYQKLFSRILRINPETQKLQDICRILLERDLASTASLLEFAFKNDSESTLKKEPLSKVHTERKGNQEINETTIGTMSNITEFPQIIKKEFLMPDSIFDRRLTRRELMVKKKQYRELRRSWDQVFQEENRQTPQKMAARQKTYLLMDVSASTEHHHRLIIEKAIAVGYLESNQKQQGEIYFRAFNQNPGPLKFCKSPQDYRRLINLDIMTAQAAGQTNLQRALETAFEDLNQQTLDSRAEILVLTDGLSPLDLSSLLASQKNCKIHLVLIGGDEPLLQQRDLRERFNQQHHGRFKDLDQTYEPHQIADMQRQLDEMFHRTKDSIKTNIIDELREGMEQLCRATGGLFIHIPDLPEALTCHQNQVDAISERVDVIQGLLANFETTGLEKEQLLDELLALRAYLTELRQRSGESSTKDGFKQLQDRMGKITVSSTELRALLDHLQIKYSSSGARGGQRLDLLDSLRVLFRFLGQFFQRFSKNAEANRASKNAK